MSYAAVTLDRSVLDGEKTPEVIRKDLEVSIRVEIGGHPVTLNGIPARLYFNSADVSEAIHQQRQLLRPKNAAQRAFEENHNV